MLEIVASVVSICAEVSKCLFAPVQSQFRHFWNYKSNFESLNQKVRKLTGQRDRLRHAVEEAERNGKKIEQDVQPWLNRADKIIDESGTFIEDEEKAKTRCFSVKTRYQLSKNAKKKAKVVVELLEEGEIFKTVSYSTIPQERWIPSSKGYESFESRTSTLKAIKKALTDPSVNMIGVYGMGGIGKTTLVKDIAMQAEKDTLFDEVVFAQVSQTPDIKRIQGEIADKLDLKFHEQGDSGRKMKLRERLSGEKKILIILDNIWTVLDLEAVGVPLGDYNKWCKVLLTARDLDVLTSKMDCKNNFHVGILREEEAWSLFKKMAGESVEKNELKQLAFDVSKECGGLPIAIVTIAKALQDKGLHHWKTALQYLQRPSERRLCTGVQADAYSSIELSYTYLRDDKLRSVFLLCSLVEDDVLILNLLKCSMGLGLFQDVNKMEDARNAIYTLLDKLKASCLLLDGQTSESVMHDVVCDVALSIACRDQHVFSLRDETDPIRWPHKESLENCTAITLLKCNTSELPEGLNCPNLRFLYIRNPGSSVKIPENFFKGMTKLKALHLTGMVLLSLPSSIRLLGNLRTLCLHNCELGDLAIIGELRELEILSFIGSNIKQLPREIGQLSFLRLLDLSYCDNLKVIPPKVISRLSRLEELYMFYSSVQWDYEGIDTVERNASLHELKHLSHLTNLEIHIEDSKILPKGLFSKKLERYNISIGDQNNWWYIKRYACKRTLSLTCSNSISIEDIMQLDGIEVLYLDELLQGIKNDLYEVNKEGFRNLKHLNVQNNPCLLCIVDPKEGVAHEAFPQLESLLLRNLIKLEKICHGQLTAKSFCQLNSIEVDKCDILKNIFSFSVVKSLPQLQTIKVTECMTMEEIFVAGREDDVKNNEVIDKIELRQLRFLTLKYLPHLASFYSRAKLSSLSQSTIPTDNEILLEDQHDTTPTALFKDMVMLPNLESLKVYAINCEKIWQYQFSAVSSSFQNLTRLIIRGCGNLNFLFSSFMVESFLKLQHLEICDCPVLNEIIVIEKLQEEDWKNIKFHQLNFLKIEELESLTRFCSENHVEFPALKRLEIKQCPKFSAFVLENVSRGLTVGEEVGISLVEIQPFFNGKVAFPYLEEMVISHLDDLKMVWNNNEIAQNSFGKLKSIKVEGCDKLQTLFSSDMPARFTQLDSLSVEDCRSLRNIFPTSIARSPLQLKDLKIVRCGILEEVVDKEGGEGPSVVMFSLPKVTHLVLRDLPELTTFYPGVHITEWPALENLEISNCEKVKVLASEFTDSQKTNDKDQLDIATQQPFFLVQKAFPKLKVLELRRNNIMMMRHSQFPRRLFGKLDTLIIEQNEEAVFPHDFLEIFYNLEMLTIHGWSLVELFPNEEVENYAGNIAQIKSLHLIMLRNLKCIWKLDSKANSIFQNLEILRVEFCNRLVQLLPSSASFQNLTTLQVRFCYAMMNLVTFSTAKSLKGLQELRIEYCTNMREIVADEGDIAEHEIVFSKLKQLSFDGLGSLTSFCSANYSFKFPALEEVTISGCPTLKTFCKGALSTPNLQKVRINGEQYFLEDDLNTTIQQMVLEVSAMEFEKIWQSQCPPMLSRFQNLKHLILQGCGNLDYLFPSSVVKTFLQLRHLEISKCPSLNEIISTEEFREEERKDINFPQLNFLRIEDLENLTRFCFERYVEFPSLERLVMKQCPKFKAFVLENVCPSLTLGEEMSQVGIKPFFNVKVVFPYLEQMEISHLDDLEMIWHNNKLTHNSFSKLSSLTVEGCDKLLTLFPSNVFESISKLSSLTVNECGSLEEIFEVQRSNFEKTFVFHLQWMSVSKCQKLKSIFLVSIAMGLSELKHLTIEDCGTLEEIFAQDGGGESSTVNSVFPKIESISITGCEKLQTLFSSNMLGRFTRLESLFVERCLSLKHIFPVSVARCLLQLKELRIEDCGVLEEIVAKEEGEEPSIVRFVFPKVKCLVLRDLPVLTTFYTRVHTVEWPVLENLEISDIGEVKVFVPESPDFLKTNDENQLDISAQRPPIFLVEKIFPTLKKLTLTKNIMMICQSQLPVHLFHNLTTLRIEDEEAEFFPLGLLEIFYNLETLQLFRSSCRELFSYQEVEKHGSKFSKIKSLQLTSHFNLKHMWKQDSRMNSILQNLEILSVKYCGNLIELAPSSASFQNLTTLEVYRCSGMVNLVTFSIAKSLEKLQEMRIRGCERITAIVANEGDVEEVEIAFSKLEKLSLADLESLTSFCSANYNFKFPALEVLTVDDCPKMNIFCEGTLSTSKLQKVRINGVQYFLEGDLNRTIQQKVLEVSAIEFERVWQIQSLEMPSHFQNLQYLTIQGCGNLRYLFPSSVLRSFLQLRHLEICKCPMLNEIINTEESTKEERKHIKFPKLNILRIEELENLTRFCLGYYVEFPSLKKLEMKQCPKFKAFVLENMRTDLTVGEGDVDMSSMELQPFFNNKVAFPDLKEMTISHLDDLKMIWHSDKLSQNSFGQIRSIKVEGCDELVTFFPSNILGRFSMLNSLIFNECGSLKEIFGLQESNLEERSSMSAFFFGRMSVTKCQSLKYIFPATRVKGFLQLCSLEIMDCPILEEIFAKKGEREPSTTKLVFPYVYSLELKNLPELTNFYPGEHTSEWPGLKSLVVDGCGKVKVFDSELLNFQKTNDEGHLCIPTQQPFFLVQKIIPNLESLSLSSQEIMMLWQGPFPGHLFSKLTVLGISDDESVVFPLGLLAKFCNVDDLKLSHCSYKELFSSEEVEEYIGSLARIKKLLLENLYEMKYMWKQDSNLNSILQNLESLNVKYCSNLINLSPPIASFQNLTTLKVCYCEGMTNLVTSSTAKSLEQLTEMSIEGCTRMTEIVAGEQDVAEDEIVFNKLEELSLVGLKSLISFCSANYTFKFPSLEVLIVRDCLKMQTFCKGALTTSMLTTVCQNREECWKLDKRCWEDDLNTTIQQLHNKMHLLSSKEDSGQRSVHHLG